MPRTRGDWAFATVIVVIVVVFIIAMVGIVTHFNGVTEDCDAKGGVLVDGSCLDRDVLVDVD